MARIFPYRQALSREGQITQFWARLRHRRAQFGLAVRVTVAALVALVISQILVLPLPLWAVLTAIIVTQVSVGRSLKAMVDYLFGTLCGAAYGAAIALLIPQTSEAALVLAVVAAIAPLALGAAFHPSLTVAPITAAIVLLLPGITHGSPLASAVDRVLEVALGGLIGFAVSYLVVPSSAHRLAIEAAARTLDQMAQAFDALFAGLGQGMDMDRLHAIQDHIGRALAGLDTICLEAERERAIRLATEPDTGPLLRTLLRLRHDLVMVGRTALVPLPAELRTRLAAPLARVETAIAGDLRACAAALQARRRPPDLDEVISALAAYGDEVTAIRGEGLTRSLPGDQAERFFALGFALEQMHRNPAELHGRVAEWAVTRGRAGTMIPKSRN
jgi:uncharacterized membrane protein YccC